MKKKVSITIDKDLLNQIEEIAKKQGTNRSKYIEKIVMKHSRQIPVLILAAKSKLEGVDKSLLEWNGKKVINHQIDYIKNQGFNDIYVSTDSQKLRSYLEKKQPEVSILFEQEKLGSGGSLKAHAEKLGRKFVYMYCDILFDLNLNKLVNFHLRNKSLLTLVLKSMKNPSKYGVAIMEGSKIDKFEEKPEKAHSHLVYIGVGIMDPEMASKLETGKFELQLNNLENKYGYIYEKYWRTFDKSGDFD